MSSIRKENILRGGLALVILLTGVAMIPFVNLPVERIGWDLFAGVYTPDLSSNETSGAPGSVFAFTGSNYPPNTTAHAYVDGEHIGEVDIDSSGVGTFKLDTSWAMEGLYNVTLEVDINASATQGIELIDGGGLVTPPTGFPGPTFSMANPVFLPLLFKN